MFALHDLPYAYDALEPSISERTLHFHHDKHHGTYVKTLNELLEKAGKTPDSLEEAIADAAKQGENGRKLFNNAAQAWNHGFFWKSMTPSGGDPAGELADAIERTFDGKAGLGDEFVDKGYRALPGSGWIWLLADRNGRP